MQRITEKCLREMVDEINKDTDGTFRLKFMNGVVALVKPINNKGGYSPYTRFMESRELALFIEGFRRGLHCIEKPS